MLYLLAWALLCVTPAAFPQGGKGHGLTERLNAAISEGLLRTEDLATPHQNKRQAPPTSQQNKRQAPPTRMPRPILPASEPPVRPGKRQPHPLNKIPLPVWKLLEMRRATQQMNEEPPGETTLTMPVIISDGAAEDVTYKLIPPVCMEESPTEEAKSHGSLPKPGTSSGRRRKSSRPARYIGVLSDLGSDVTDEELDSVDVPVDVMPSRRQRRQLLKEKREEAKYIMNCLLDSKPYPKATQPEVLVPDSEKRQTTPAAQKRMPQFATAPSSVTTTQIPVADTQIPITVTPVVTTDVVNPATQFVPNVLNPLSIPQNLAASPAPAPVVHQAPTNPLCVINNQQYFVVPLLRPEDPPSNFSVGNASSCMLVPQSSDLLNTSISQPNNDQANQQVTPVHLVPNTSCFSSAASCVKVEKSPEPTPTPLNLSCRSEDKSSARTDGDNKQPDDSPQHSAADGTADTRGTELPKRSKRKRKQIFKHVIDSSDSSGEPDKVQKVSRKKKSPNKEKKKTGVGGSSQERATDNVILPRSSTSFTQISSGCREIKRRDITDILTQVNQNPSVQQYENKQMVDHREYVGDILSKVANISSSAYKYSSGQLNEEPAEDSSISCPVDKSLSVKQSPSEHCATGQQVPVTLKNTYHEPSLEKPSYSTIKQILMGNPLTSSQISTGEENSLAVEQASDKQKQTLVNSSSEELDTNPHVKHEGGGKSERDLVRAILVNASDKQKQTVGNSSSEEAENNLPNKQGEGGEAEGGKSDRDLVRAILVNASIMSSIGSVADKVNKKPVRPDKDLVDDILRHSPRKKGPNSKIQSSSPSKILRKDAQQTKTVSKGIAKRTSECRAKRTISTENDQHLQHEEPELIKSIKQEPVDPGYMDLPEKNVFSHFRKYQSSENEHSKVSNSAKVSKKNSDRLGGTFRTLCQGFLSKRSPAKMGSRSRVEEPVTTNKGTSPKKGPSSAVQIKQEPLDPSETLHQERNIFSLFTEENEHGNLKTNTDLCSGPEPKGLVSNSDQHSDTGCLIGPKTQPSAGKVTPLSVQHMKQEVMDNGGDMSPDFHTTQACSANSTPFEQNDSSKPVVKNCTDPNEILQEVLKTESTQDGIEGAGITIEPASPVSDTKLNQMLFNFATSISSSVEVPVIKEEPLDDGYEAALVGSTSDGAYSGITEKTEAEEVDSSQSAKGVGINKIHVDNKKSLTVRSSRKSRRKSVHCVREDPQCFCGQSFVCRAKLEDHKRLHTGEKPWKCPTCGKCFARQDVLKRHRKIHANDRRFPCNFCPKRFLYLYELKRHRWTHTGEKRFECHLCGKQLSQMTGLKRHLDVHKGDKPYSCNICHRKFGRKGVLLKHMGRRHKSYKNLCPICGMGFRSKSVQIGHLASHSGTKRNQCVVCKAQFSGRYWLKKHMCIHSESSKKS